MFGVSPKMVPRFRFRTMRLPQLARASSAHIRKALQHVYGVAESNIVAGMALL